jgi:hypothetical protein
VIGKKGRGKTYVAKGLVERLLDLGRRVVVLIHCRRGGASRRGLWSRSRVPGLVVIRRSEAAKHGPLPTGVGSPELSSSGHSFATERVASKKRGVKFGRKPKLTPMQIDLALRIIDEGQPVLHAADAFGINEKTFTIARRPPRLLRSPTRRKALSPHIGLDRACPSRHCHDRWPSL